MKRLFKLARSKIGKYLIGWIFEHMSFIIPVKRLRETEHLMAFHHPKPSYPLHILLVPKKAIQNLTDLSNENNDFLPEVFMTAQSLIDEFKLEVSGYRLILNGGQYQDVPQLHFHLISGNQEKVD